MLADWARHVLQPTSADKEQDSIGGGQTFDAVGLFALNASKLCVGRYGVVSKQFPKRLCCETLKPTAQPRVRKRTLAARLTQESHCVLDRNHR